MVELKLKEVGIITRTLLTLMCDLTGEKKNEVNEIKWN